MNIKQQYCWYLIGALLVGFLVRIPGIFWGYNFPSGWYGHHIDEYTHVELAESMIDPFAVPRWKPRPYPKGMAAHVAVPIVGFKAITRGLLQFELTPIQIIVGGRIISFLYGTATIFIVFLLGRKLFGDIRAAVVAAWIMALGGLHISESHYFLADVPSIFWYLTGVYFLLAEIQAEKGNYSQHLVAAALCYCH